MRLLYIVMMMFVLAACSTDNRSTPFFATTNELNRDARASWAEFMTENDAAQTLNEDAYAVLIFPNIIKGGFIGGGQYGDGIMIKGDEVLDYYNSVSASYGLQAGIQRYAYALVFTNEKALEYVNRSEGWEIGVGPSIVIADRGLGRNLTSTTLRADVYAFVYGQQGLMAGGGIQGTKITRRIRDK